MGIQLIVSAAAYSTLYTLPYFIYLILLYIPYSTLYTQFYLTPHPPKPMQF